MLQRIPLETKNFSAGSTVTVPLRPLTAQYNLRHIMLKVEASVTEDNTGDQTLAWENFFDMFALIEIEPYFRMRGRQIADRFYLERGRREENKSDHTATQNQTTTFTFYVHIPFYDEDSPNPDECNFPCSLLPEEMRITFAAATVLDANVSINTATVIRPIAEVVPANPYVAPRLREMAYKSVAAENFIFPAGQYDLMFLRKTDGTAFTTGQLDKIQIIMDGVNVTGTMDVENLKALWDAQRGRYIRTDETGWLGPVLPILWKGGNGRVSKQPVVLNDGQVVLSGGTLSTGMEIVWVKNIIKSEGLVKQILVSRGINPNRGTYRVRTESGKVLKGAGPRAQALRGVLPGKLEV